MYNCTYMITPDEKHGYIVRVRELPGLSDDGISADEAIANIQKDIAMAIELKASMGQALEIKQIATEGASGKPDTLKYRGYEGSVLYSEDDHCLYGEVLGVRDTILYEGSSLEELEGDFRSMVDLYLQDSV